MACLNCHHPDCRDESPGCVVAHIQKLTNRVAALERDRSATNVFVHPVLNNTGKLFRYQSDKPLEQITSDGGNGFWAITYGGILHCKITTGGSGSVKFDGDEVEYVDNVLRGKIDIAAFSTRNGELFYALDAKGNAYIFSRGKQDFVSTLENVPEYTPSQSNPKILVRTPVFKPRIRGKVKRMVTTSDSHYILDELNLTRYSLDFSESNIVFNTVSSTDFWVTDDTIYIPTGIIFICTPTGSSKGVVSTGKGQGNCVFVENNLMVVAHNNNKITVSRTDGKLAKEIFVWNDSFSGSPRPQSMFVDTSGRIIVQHEDGNLSVIY